MEKLSPKEMITEIIPTEMIDQVIAALKLARQTEEISTFDQMMMLDEKPSFFRIKTLPVTNSDDMLIVIDDITELKLAEATIRQHAVELEERNRELDAFSRTVAHDLKSPLGNIVMLAHAVLTEEQDRLSPLSQEYLHDMQEMVFIMSEMVNNLLLFAKLRNAKELMKVVAMAPVIQATLTRLQVEIAERGVLVDVGADLPDVMGHGPWLVEVLANLISNAVKYIGQDNPAPHIAIHGHRQDGMVRYEVQDNGLGIAPADQARLFEIFARFHKREAKGTGLGLSIVQRIISKIGGEVGAESVPGHGSTFWFVLPAPPL